MLTVALLLIFVFFAGVAMTVNEGLWSNSVNLLVLLISCPTAITLGIPAGLWGHEQADMEDSALWYFAFGGVWLVFFLTMLILRILCEKISRTKLRFLPVVDRLGGGFVGALLAYVFTSFLALTIIFFPLFKGEWKTYEAAEWELSTVNRFSIPAKLVFMSFDDTSEAVEIYKKAIGK